MRTLHMYKEECDTVIAESPKDAMAVWCEHTGDSYADEFGTDMGEPEDAWELVPDAQSVTLHFPDEPDRQPETRTAAEWCASNGRCYWGSTEY